MHVVILGVGALAGLFGGHLAALPESEVRVTLVGSRHPRLEALRRDGLTLIRRDGRRQRLRPTVLAADELPEKIVEPAGLVLVLVKSYQTQEAARRLGRLLAKEPARPPLVVTLQNGLGNLERLAAVAGEENVGLGVTVQAALVEGTGAVLHTGEGPTHLAPPPGASAARTEAAVALLCRAGLEAHLAGEVRSLLWSKLAVNAAINPLSALRRVPNGALLEDPVTRDLLGEAAEEVAAVAAAQGISLIYASARQRAEEVCRATASNRSSMLQDLEAGRLTEIDAICGAVVRLGRHLGVATPVNERLLWDVLTAVEARDRHKKVAAGGLGSA